MKLKDIINEGSSFSFKAFVKDTYSGRNFFYEDEIESNNLSNALKQFKHDISSNGCKIINNQCKEKDVYEWISEFFEFNKCTSSDNKNIWKYVNKILKHKNGKKLDPTDEGDMRMLVNYASNKDLKRNPEENSMYYEDLI